MIRRKILQKDIHNYILCLIAFTLPLSIKANSICIILLTLNFVVYKLKGFKTERVLSNKLFFVFTSFYFIQALGFLYSSDYHNAFNQLEVKLTILIFPIVTCISLNKKTIRWILIAFLCSCIGICIFSFLYYGVYLGRIKSLYNMVHFALPLLNIHPVYFSMYLLFCVAILWYFKTKRILNNKISYLLISFIVPFIFLFASRSIIILLAIGVFGFVFYNFYNKGRVLIGILSMFMLFALTCIVLFSIPVTKNKFEDILNISFKKSELMLKKENRFEKDNGIDFRIAIWRSSQNLLTDNLIFGVGTGDAEEELIKQYKKFGFVQGIIKEYNAHNEYLQESIRHGIVGLLLLLAMFLWPLILSFKRKKYLYSTFIIIFMWCCLWESMLGTQKGVVFYAFFNSLLAFNFLSIKK